MSSSTPPRHLLDPPDVDGLVAWVRAAAGPEPGRTPSGLSDATTIAREQLTRVLTQSGRTGSASPSILGAEDRWRLPLHPRLRSHRAALGGFIVWCKRTLIRPLIRWHVEFTEETASRQAYVNESLVTLIEHLAARIVLLEAELEKARRPASESAAPPGERL